MHNPRPRAVVSLSGGMDSAVCASLAARDYDAYALHFSYGQRTEGRELQSARTIAEQLGFQDFLHLKIDLFRRIGGSALTDSSIAIPKASADHPIGSSIPSNLRPLPQRALPFRRRKLGRSPGRRRPFSSARSSRTAPATPTAGPPIMRRFSNLSAPGPGMEASKSRRRSSISGRRRL